MNFPYSLSPLEISRGLLFILGIISFLKKKLGHVLLKLTEWLRKGSFYKLSMFCLWFCFLWVFHFFLGGGGFLFLFLLSSYFTMYFCYILLLSASYSLPLEKCLVFLFDQGRFVPSVVEIDSVVLENNMKMWKDWRQTDRIQVIRKVHLSFQLRWVKK